MHQAAPKLVIMSVAGKVVSNLVAIAFFACIALYFLGQTKRFKSSWRFHLLYTFVAGLLAATQLYLTIFGLDRIVSGIFSLLCLWGTFNCYSNFYRLRKLDKYVKKTAKEKQPEVAPVIKIDKYKN